MTNEEVYAGGLLNRALVGGCEIRPLADIGYAVFF
jgi:hypothetical protein